MKTRFPAIFRAKAHSNEKLTALREGISQLVPQGEIVLTCGSYARREASKKSDIDFFVITQEATSLTGRCLASGTWFERATRAINDIVPVEPAEDGAFSKVESIDAMLHNIGGEHDDNAKMTRRVLFLLEGEWLANPSGLKEMRHRILERYVGSGISDHQLALFLLNDIIRYYRTMAVDYEFKTGEGPNPKPCGIRNIKLVFSRKLLYASGLFSIGRTADQARAKIIELLEKLFELPVIDRMIEMCGEPKNGAFASSYDHFLQKLEEPEIRDRLKALTREEREDPLFRELKNEGHNFTRELMKLFEDTFDSTHPIHRAAIF